MILSPGTLPSSPIIDTDVIPSHDPLCVKPVVGFNVFPIGFGGNQGTA